MSKTICLTFKVVISHELYFILDNLYKESFVGLIDNPPNQSSKKVVQLESLENIQ